VLDLPGGHVLPGFVDAHQHPSLTAWVPQGTDGIG
jgi:predicted amidohydrolase YtcJ